MLKTKTSAQEIADEIQELAEYINNIHNDGMTYFEAFRLAIEVFRMEYYENAGITESLDGIKIEIGVLSDRINRSL